MESLSHVVWALLGEVVVQEIVTAGVKGGLPLGCFPLWGREGVTLITTIEDP